MEHEPPDFWVVLRPNRPDVQGLQVPESFKMPSTGSSLATLFVGDKQVGSSVVVLHGGGGHGGCGNRHSPRWSSLLSWWCW